MLKQAGRISVWPVNAVVCEIYYVFKAYSFGLNDLGFLGISVRFGCHLETRNVYILTV